MPLDLVRRIAFILPPSLYGVLNFGYQYAIYYKCAGSDYFGQTVTFVPKKNQLVIFNRNNDTVNTTTVSCSYSMGKFTLEGFQKDSIRVLRDVEYGGVYFEYDGKNLFQLSGDELKSLHQKNNEIFRGGPIDRGYGGRRNNNAYRYGDEIEEDVY